MIEVLDRVFDEKVRWNYLMLDRIDIVRSGRTV